MAPAGASDRKDQGMGESVADIWQLVRDYAKQETIDPLRSIGRFLGFGILGALLLSAGIFFGALALLRGLQSRDDTFLNGTWDFVPYLAAFVLVIALAAIAALAITRPFRNEKDHS